MKDKPANLPASVLARLRNLAREKGTDYQLILRRYALERLLCRLAISPFQDRYILKGAMLFIAWLKDPFRPTKDLDLLGYGDSTEAAVAEVFREICRMKTEDDGVIYDVENLNAEPIREDQQYDAFASRQQRFSARPESRCRSISASEMLLRRQHRSWSFRHCFHQRARG